MAINLNGTTGITTTGLTSNGIDDNATSTAMTLDTSNNVGIGTSSPTGKLHLQGSTGGYLELKMEPSADTDVSSISFRNAADNQTKGYVLYDHTSNYMGFRTNGSGEAMRIDSSGNLLVGTTNSGLYAVSSGSGFTYLPGSSATFARESNSATKPVLILNETGMDGTLLDLRKNGTTVGSIGVYSSDNLYLQGKSDHSGLAFGEAEIYGFRNGSENDGVTSLGSSAGRFKDLYLSGGVYLGGTGSANKLDDMEEGTWTPSLTFGGSPAGLTYSFPDTSGTYTKVGRKVTVFGRITLTSRGTGGSGQLFISSLPFVPGPQWSGLQIGFIRNTSTGLYQKNLHFTIDPGATTAPFRFLNSSGGFGGVGWADITDTFDVIFSGSYEV